MMTLIKMLGFGFFCFIIGLAVGFDSKNKI